MDTASQERIAHQVYEERKRRRLTQKELASLAGVAANTIGAMERGESFPQKHNLGAILRALGIEAVVAAAEEEVEQPIVEDGGWSPDVKVALNVIGLYLESYPPEAREEHITTIVRAIMTRTL